MRSELIGAAGRSKLCEEVSGTPMPFETLVALFGLAAAAAWTPGPNNLMLAASGVNFGFRRTIPHIAGIVLGFPVMIFVVGIGVGAVIAENETIREAMRWGGAALLLWFAWRIATAGKAEAADRSRPLTIWEAAGFQWINPKSWAMAMATTSQFVTGANIWLESAICGGAYVIAGLGATTTWSAFGVAIRRFLNSEIRLRAFNITMGLLIASFVVFLFKDKF